jgi:hypothetical protein
MMSEHDLIPNFTQFPNKLMDYVIPLLRESEEKVLIYVLRCTYGYRDEEGKQREQDYISYSQFMGGQVSREGKLLNFGAGVSRSKLTEALAFHQATGLIERLDPAAGKFHAGRGSTGLYRLNRHCELVHFLNQCLQDPETAKKKMVQFLNQKRLLVQKVNQSRNKVNTDKPHKVISSESEPIKNGSESEPLPQKNGSESEPEMVQKVNQPNKEKEKERDKDTPPIISPSFSAPAKKWRQKVTSPPPEAFAPSEKLIAWQHREFPQYDLADAIESCLDHYRKKGDQASDYEAAIRNWFRSGHKYGTLKKAAKPNGLELSL